MVVQLVDPHYLTFEGTEGRNGVTLYCTLHSAWALEVY